MVCYPTVIRRWVHGGHKDTDMVRKIPQVDQPSNKKCTKKPVSEMLTPTTIMSTSKSHKSLFFPHSDAQQALLTVLTRLNALSGCHIGLA